MTEKKRESLREKRRRETRDLLLTALIDLVTDKGFQATSIEDITQEAGTSRATFYAYFDSKDAALAAALDQSWDEAEAIYTQFGALADWSTGTISDWLTTFATTWRATARRNFAVAQGALAQLPPGRPSGNDRLARAARARTELWAHFTEPEADTRATMMVLLLQDMFTHHFFSTPSGDLDLLVHYLTSAVRDLLQADRA